MSFARASVASLAVVGLLTAAPRCDPAAQIPRAAHPDADGNGFADAEDARFVAACLGRDPDDGPPCASADLNRDGTVDADDFLSLSPDLDSMVCNTAVDLCDRRYDEIAHATTHNAFSALLEGFVGANQFFGMSLQLADGVRGLMLDTHYYTPPGGEESTYLCHGVGNCGGGNRPLVDGLLEIRSFLDARPHEVVTLILESYVSEADTQAALAAAGLVDFAYAHPPEASQWPTLRQMIESGRRLVVFTDDRSASLPWHHYVWDHAWETRFSFTSPDQFGCGETQPPEDYGCAGNRGSPANPLFILNHFITLTTGAPNQAAIVNREECLLTRALQCEAETGHFQNFITVDFWRFIPGFLPPGSYTRAEFFRVVDTLNELPGFELPQAE